MMLVTLILLPLIAAIVAGFATAHAARWIAVGALVVELMLAVSLGMASPAAGEGAWLARLELAWIPRFGISFLLAADGLSVILITLTAGLGLAAVASSWAEITERPSFFHFNVLASLTGAIGVFLALDLFLFFFFWEVMLIPMYFLIGIWGHGNRVYSALKFFLFTQASSLLMLAAIIALALLHQDQTGSPSFSYFDLRGVAPGGAMAMWLMLGFFLAFAVKLPAVPFHTWLPDAHTDAPTAGSVILAGILLKTGAYGLLRFLMPLFPDAAAQFTPIALALGVIGVLYGAAVAFAQSDFKRLVAYTSVSHMGFVLLGVFAWNTLALQGVVMQLVAHGLSTGALFMIAGSLQERLHTRELGDMGGLWTTAPRMSALGMFFAIASLGLPGLANFLGEFLVLMGTYRASVAATAFAAIGLVLAAVYSLWLVQRSFHGRLPEGLTLADTGTRETVALGTLALLLIWLGLMPGAIFGLAAPALEGLMP
jgi:NADH-quinone oxidoreductase subunit M